MDGEGVLLGIWIHSSLFSLSTEFVCMYSIGEVSNCSEVLIYWVARISWNDAVRCCGYSWDRPVRPTINWMNAPDYKLAKHLVRISEQRATPPYSFDIRNRAALLMHLKNITFHEDVRLASFDVRSTSTDIPTDKLENITSVFSFNRTNEDKKQAIVCYCGIILQQNCWHYKHSQYTQKKLVLLWTPPPPNLLFFPRDILTVHWAYFCTGLLKHHKIVGYF
jgi:hypothetical protein